MVKRLFGQSIALVVNGYNSPKSQNQRRCELCAQPQVDANVHWVGLSLGIKGKISRSSESENGKLMYMVLIQHGRISVVVKENLPLFCADRLLKMRGAGCGPPGWNHSTSKVEATELEGILP